MATPSSPQHEPTMEEILASIRKIISEDSSEPAQPAQAAAQPAVAAQAEGDVLELTQEVEEAPEPEPVETSAPVQLAAAPVQMASPAPEPARPADDVVFQTIEEAPVNAVAQTSARSTEGLVSDKARTAVDDALSALDFGPDEAPHTSAMPVATVTPIDGRSVEDLFDRAVRETFDPVLRAWMQEHADSIVDRMKPAIREWMDDHLPSMLRTAVEAEVARAVKARTRR